MTATTALDTTIVNIIIFVILVYTHAYIGSSECHYTQPVCFVLIDETLVTHFISSFTVSDYGIEHRVSTVLPIKTFTDSARLRKHENDLVRVSRAMRYGQLQSNDRMHRSEQQIKDLALEFSKLKDETKRLRFMIDDLEERYVETSMMRNEDL